MAIRKGMVLFVFSAIFVASNFIPYSLGGAAMSCVTAHVSPQAAEQAVKEFMKTNSTNYGEVTRYLQRSDFEVRGGHFDKAVDSKNPDVRSSEFSVVYLSDDSNYNCPVFSAAIRLLPYSERTWIKLTLVPTPREPSGDAMVSKVEGK
jgi:hypothetical protein